MRWNNPKPRKITNSKEEAKDEQADKEYQKKGSMTPLFDLWLRIDPLSDRRWW
jgi:hypothetical protein